MIKDWRWISASYPLSEATWNFGKRLTQKNLKSSPKLKNIIKKCKLVGENGDKVAKYWNGVLLG